MWLRSTLRRCFNEKERLEFSKEKGLKFSANRMLLMEAAETSLLLGWFETYGWVDRGYCSSPMQVAAERKTIQLVWVIPVDSLLSLPDCG